MRPECEYLAVFGYWMDDRTTVTLLKASNISSRMQDQIGLAKAVMESVVSRIEISSRKKKTLSEQLHLSQQATRILVNSLTNVPWK